MPDRHMNIFYSYDHKLCEDNMTRALILTLRTISAPTRKLILARLLQGHIKLDFLQWIEGMEFALQGNIPQKDKIKEIPDRYLISLTGHNLISEEHKFGAQEQDRGNEDLSRVRPDAWIYDGSKKPRYCFLIECKTVEAELKAGQIIAYGKRFFGLKHNSEVARRIIKLTWFEISEVCDDVLSRESISNQQEGEIIRNLLEYLAFSGVVPFKGLPLAKIPDLPDIGILIQIDRYIEAKGFNLGRMPEVPDYIFPLK